MNPVSAVQPIVSYPIVSAITSLASIGSRFCGFTDLGESISLIRQGEYRQAYGRAFEGALRLGVLVAVACCVKKLAERDEAIEELSQKLQNADEVRISEVLKVQKELKQVQRELKMEKESLIHWKEKAGKYNTDAVFSRAYLEECRKERTTFEDSNIDLQKELAKMKVNAGWCETALKLNPFGAAPSLAKKSDDGCSNKKVEKLQTDLNDKIGENLQLKDTLESVKAEKERCEANLASSADVSRTIVPLLTSAELKALYEKSLTSKSRSFDAKAFLCKDVPGQALDCTTGSEIKKAFNQAIKRCKPDSYKDNDRMMASRIQQMLMETKNKLIAQISEA